MLGYLAAAGTLDGGAMRRGLRGERRSVVLRRGRRCEQAKAVHRADVMMRLEALRSITKTGG